ncbi:TlpA disulfide reductase family protein [Clostridium sp.]|uniref:TlpA disulfide reductase family protein n=1 Tax=Clostridium sp. TaxID=1506 RepID=UPI001A3DC861|nr:redoxin domain-containing protein [Clostridium sp.]MBK5235045.1 redoxin domain-containing protein [Clostridium sp.]
MKKIIWPLVIVLLFGISIYSVTNYNKNKAEELAIAAQEDAKAQIAIQNAKDSADAKVPAIEATKDAASKIAAQDFKLKDLNGKEVSLSDFKGKKVYLNFWASWCGPCKSEMPDIEKLYNETKESDLVILAVNLGETKIQTKSFIDDNKYTFPILLDLDQSVANQYTIQYIPTSYFIDKEGNIVSKISGALTLAEMKDNISKL